MSHKVCDADNACCDDGYEYAVRYVKVLMISKQGSFDEFFSRDSDVYVFVFVCFFLFSSFTLLM